MTGKNWTDEEYGIPHKNGHVRFYMIGFEEDAYEYLGWHDMTDWDEGWKKMWKAAQESRNGKNIEEFQILRHDQMLDLMRNVQYAFEEALEDKEETTWIYWYKQEQLKEELKENT